MGLPTLPHDRQAAEIGDNLAQKFESLSSEISELDRQAGDVATRSRQTSDDARANRIACPCEDDRNECCRLLCREGW